jgi:hypothetical protein
LNFLAKQITEVDAKHRVTPPPRLELSYLFHPHALFPDCQQPCNPPQLLHHCRVRLKLNFSNVQQ